MNLSPLENLRVSRMHINVITLEINVYMKYYQVSLSFCLYVSKNFLQKIVVIAFVCLHSKLHSFRYPF